MIFKDGHIHSPFCPHGSTDLFEEYIERAIDLGFREISFTEHAPLPEGFIDTVPAKDSAMKMDDLWIYFDEIDRLKEKYQRDIKILTGLEVDYIEGFEKESKSFLNRIGHKLDDAILSVHFLKIEENFDCIDYSPEVFQSSAKRLGSLEKLHEKYYSTVMKSILADLGPYKPKRIGHITLVKKFRKKFPVEKEFTNEISEILVALKSYGYELDYNGAGTAKPLCREPYPSAWIVDQALTLGIPLIYGSDAHQVKDLGQGISEMRFK